MKLALAAVVTVAALAAADPTAVTVRGRVTAGGSPVAGATVRVQGTSAATVTGNEGDFVLTVPAGARLTAWAPGFFCAGPVEVAVGTADLALELAPVPAGDNSSYRWLSAVAGTAEGGARPCADCHSEGGDGELPVDQWMSDAHARSATNPRFLTMYDGTDVAGRRSPSTRLFTTRDYGTVRLPPDPTRSYHGPGYVLDFPTTRGNCAACHLPVAAAGSPYEVDPRRTEGVAREGVTCDFCHKMWDVVFDPATGLPFPERPGVLSIRLHRPPDGHQLFVGPFDDVAPGEDTRLPLVRASRMCAPCHYGVFWGVEIYGSYAEWLASAYADPQWEGARTCQGCHMPRGLSDHFARLDRGGLRRDAAEVAGHRMPGAADPELLRAAAELVLEATREGDVVRIAATVTNSGTGHHLPTDSPLRQVLLLISVCSSDGTGLPLVSGPVLPGWAGPEAGRPGRAYAKVLEERWTRIAPTGAYWNPVRVAEDTRLAAFAADRAEWCFAGAETTIMVDAVLVLRRAFWELARQKGWNDPDLEMKHARVTIAAHAKE